MNIASAPSPIFANEIFQLNPADVVVGERIGLFWPEKAAAIGALMARDGQTDPIKVVNRSEQWHLVAGLHRLQGARGLGLQKIDAIEVCGTPAVLRRLEASENVHRRDFGPLERAMFVRAICDDVEARWSQGYEGLSAQQIGQIKRWEQARAKAPGVVRDDEAAALHAQSSSAMLGGTYGWQQEAAESLGLSIRSVARSLMFHRKIVEPFERQFVEDFAVIPNGDVASSVEALCRIQDVETRRRVMAAMIDEPSLSVADALAQVGLAATAGKPRLTGDSKHMDGAQSNLARLSVSGWKQFAPTLVEMVKPSALPVLMAQIEARMLELGDAVLGGGDD